MPITKKIINAVSLLCLPVIAGGFVLYNITKDITKDRISKQEYYSRPIVQVSGKILNESYDSFWGYGEYEIVIETEDGKKIVGNFGDTRGSPQKARTYDNLYDPGDEVEIKGRNNEELAEEFGVELFLEDMEINED